MAGYNGSGVFSFSYPNFITGTVINSTQMNQNFADGKSGFDLALTRDGQGVATANLPMATFRHTGVDPTSGTNSRTEYLASGVAQNSGNVYASTTGSANAYVLTLTPAITAYAAGQTFRAKANFSNTGAATIAVSGLTATAIQKNGAALVANDIVSGNIIEIVHDGTQFQLVSRMNVAAANTWTGIQTFSNGIIFANETFANYDEGTWTAGIICGTSGTVTLSGATLKYIRVGNAWTVTGRGIVGSVSSPSGSATVTGLPGTIFNADGNLTSGVVLAQSWTASLTTQPISRGISNTTTLILYILAATTGNTSTNVANLLQANSELTFNTTFFSV